MNMYTTPRKVKQESRLRRSLSLTNTTTTNNRSNNTDEDEEGGSGINYCYQNGGAFGGENGSTSTTATGVAGGNWTTLDHHQNSVLVAVPPPPYRAPPCALTSSSSGVPGGSGDPQQQFSSLPRSGLAGGRGPFQPAGEQEDYGAHFQLPNSVPDRCTYDTHSSKFPVVRQVTFSKESLDTKVESIPTLNEFYKNQNRKKKIAWLDERKAFTLDSRTAKDFQEHLIFTPSTILRRNSLDLEKFLKVFNEEQSLGMASMQNGRILMSHPSSGEVEEMLQHNGHAHGAGGINGIYGKMNGNGYYQQEQQQSLSLSSSNADSLDTVIYKGQAQGPSSQSIRDWQRSMDSGLEYQGGSGMYLDQRGGYHVQQTANNGGSYQPLGYNGPTGNSNVNGHGNNFTIEYHRAQQQGSGVQQQQQHQSLSIQSNQTGGNIKNNVHSETHGHHVRSGSTAGILSQPQQQQQQQYRNGGVVNGGEKRFGSNPQLASKSPALSHKLLVVNPSESEQGKKDSNTKLFHNKTYNHIKDMISSRFGSANNSVQNNKVVNNDGTKVNGHLNNGYNDSPPYGNQNTMNYGLQQQQQQQQQQQSQEYGYYQSPSAAAQPVNQAPPNSNGMIPQHRHTHSIMAGGPLPPPSSYRSPALNDSRKNVNTSFRKAIQHSSQKSNLADDSVQMMRSIMENTYRGQQQQQQQGQQFLDAVGAERAQRALDKLCENGQMAAGGSPMATGSPQYVNNRQPQQGGYLAGNVETRNGPPSADNNPHSRHRFNTKPGMTSPPSNNGMAVVENSHSVAFTKSTIANHGIANEAFQGNDEYNEPPPPLPTSQQPNVAGLKQQEINTIGLPLSSEQRENGDGSSGSLETGGSKNVNEPRLSGSDNHDQLKLSAELQKLALSNTNNEHQSSSSECEKSSQRVGSGQSHTTTDSGHGTVLLAKSPLHSSDPSEPAETGSSMMIHRQKLHEQIGDSISSGNDSEWVDIVEPEIRQILENEKLKSMNTAAAAIPMAQERKAPPSYASPRSQSSSKMPNGGSLSDLASSAPVNSGMMRKSPKQSPKASKKYDLSYPKANEPAPGTSQQAAAAAALQALANARLKSPRSGGNLNRSDSGSQQQLRLNGWSSRQRLTKDGGVKPGSSNRKELPMKPGKLTRSAMNQILYSLQDDNGDMTSTTTGLDLESMLDGATEATSDDDDLSTTIDTTDAYAIKRQIQSLETMYSEVLKVLHGKKLPGNRYPPTTSDLRNAKRRPYGSMSSLPSSVSSRPFRERKKVDDAKKVKDLKSINRRFQRLESHVVTLARSVAHLSSEMRTQHLMVQEMESIRNEMSQLRNQVVKAAMQSHNNSSSNFARVASGRNGAAPHVSSADWSSFRNALPSLTNPSRVRKLTKFFGDEPPLIRIFLKKLGYEKYATAFEQERIGIMELPYLTEERLNKMGIPMGPRLRILQEAHSCLKPQLLEGGHQSHHHHQIPDGGKLSVYVV